MTFLATENSIDDDQPRKIVMHVNFAEGDQLNFVLNNVENISEYYRGKGNDVEIRVVCHGLGLHMLRVDTSPVKDRLTGMADSMDELTFFACTNTIERMTKAEGERPVGVDQAALVQAGLPEIIELQRMGWTYLKP